MKKEIKFRLFVSSPGDVEPERRMVGFVVERLNGEFGGHVQIETIRWETAYYRADATFQMQIPEASECDLVVAIFRGRLGTPLPADFRSQPSGEPYASGTAYEVLTAIAARKSGKDLPDVYVFRYQHAPSVALDSPNRCDVEAQWLRLETFFDDNFKTESGEFLSAYQSYSSIDEFAGKVEDCLRQWLADPKRGFVTNGPVWDRDVKGSPFPGLSFFDDDRKSIFFGRDLAIAEAIERLRQRGTKPHLPFLLLIGASGCGKSSFIRAGLLPELTLPGSIPSVDYWRTAVLMLGPDPFLLLADALFEDTAIGPELRTGAFATRELLAAQLGGNCETAVVPIHEAMTKVTARREEDLGSPCQTRLAIAVDQGERLFTEIAPSVANTFLALLEALLAENLAYIVFALRSDAYPRMQNVESLMCLRKAGAIFDLVAPGAFALEQIVRQPIEACRPTLVFEEQNGVTLAARLVDDAHGGDALPLLQITLNKLYAAQVVRGDGVLRFSDYRGMAAAVTETANEALAQLSDEAKNELPALIAVLVTDIVTDPITKKPIPAVGTFERNVFEFGQPARQALVMAFIDKRLLTTEGDENSQRARPVHEALLRIWPEAVAILNGLIPLIRVRHALEPIVREWQDATQDMKAGYLEISRALLEGGKLLINRLGLDIPAEMRQFVAEAAGAADAREKEEHEIRLREAEKAAEANRRTAQVRGLLFVLSLICILFISWGWWDISKTLMKTETIIRQTEKLSAALSTENSSFTDVFIKSGDFKSALNTYDNEIGILDELSKSDPKNSNWRRELAVAYDNKGRVLKTMQRFDDALTSYNHALEIREHIVDLALENRGYPDAKLQLEISDTYINIGDLYLAWNGHFELALRFYEKSLRIRETIAASSGENFSAQDALAESYEKIGDAYRERREFHLALQSYLQSQKIRKAIADRPDQNPIWERNLWKTDQKLGIIYTKLRLKPEALQALQDARRVLQSRLDRNPDQEVSKSLDVIDQQIAELHDE